MRKKKEIGKLLFNVNQFPYAISPSFLVKLKQIPLFDNMVIIYSPILSTSTRRDPKTTYDISISDHNGN